MLPVANTILVGPKVLPVVLAVGGATVAGSFVRAQARTRTFQYSAARPDSIWNQPAEPQSKFFDLVLESIFS
ncbi:hypothetical protein B0T10DRAFT_502323 [Thelonectria olida]|uniref:Uncharacterized protein n=1 Tax=Thelonectria olida TaxID=1576542 RepID=A0A9P9AJ69_9HYPO|nr:hypothetical protein B0T10DRAFT_502323 [Thelonectria olida]